MRSSPRSMHDNVAMGRDAFTDLAKADAGASALVATTLRAVIWTPLPRGLAWSSRESGRRQSPHVSLVVDGVNEGCHLRQAQPRKIRNPGYVICCLGNPVFGLKFVHLTTGNVPSNLVTGE